MILEDSVKNFSGEICYNYPRSASRDFQSYGVQGVDWLCRYF